MSDLYPIFESVIRNSPYNLVDMEKKIYANWVQSFLTDEERDQLMALAMEHANPDNDYAPLLDQVADLRQRVEALENARQSSEAGAAEEWPEFVTPEDAAHAYHYGDKITWRGQHYVCIRQGKNVVHDPQTYPIGWATEEMWREMQTGEGDGV